MCISIYQYDTGCYVRLSVRYRNHFPVFQFQNQAHIWNPRGTGHIFKTIWGAEVDPIFFLLFYRRRRRRKLTPRPGRLRRPNLFLFFSSRFSFTAAEGGGFSNGRRRHPKGGAQGAQRWRRWRHFTGGRGKSRRKQELASMFLNF